MNLNAEQLAVLVRTLSQEDSETSAEKRRAPRASHPGTVSIVICRAPLDIADDAPGDACTHQAAVRVANLSSRGIALLHAEPLSVGQRFMIQLPRQIDHHVHILCTVAHCTPQGEGLYNIGAEFTGVVPAETRSGACGKRPIAYA
jgi:hypothetical protein